jgi:hypothetical protein
VPVNPQPDAAERHLNTHGINEMPAGYDAEVAELFRDLRSATTLSENDLAMRLGTRPEVIQSLEQGALFALPAWPETCRVVNAYGALLNLDVRPLLRRIYAQLEAGIVELQPKPMPDVPIMAPPEPRDFGTGFGAHPPGGNNAAGAHAANPLDIPWPPPQQSMPQVAPPNAWPNAQSAPPPQATPWPPQQAAPQPQNAWQGGQPQQQPQTWQPMPQGQRPAPAQPHPTPSPQSRPDGQAPQSQSRPRQAQAPQPQPRPRPQPQPQVRQPAAPRPVPPPPEPDISSHPLAADFTAELAPPPPEPKKKRGRPALLKWGLGALIISAVAFGLWFALSQVPGPSTGPGAGQTQNGTIDPDDPRSRKADKLPSPPGG